MSDGSETGCVTKLSLWHFGEELSDVDGYGVSALRLSFNQLEGANPDVSKTDGRVMLLDDERAGARLGMVCGSRFVLGGAEDLLVVLNEYTVPEDGHASRFDELVAVEFGGEEHGVEGLPLAWFAGGIGERRELTVDGAGDSVGVDMAGFGLDDLEFVESVEEDAAVSPVHGAAVVHGRCCPFEVELAVAEVLLGGEPVCFDDVDGAVFDGVGRETLPLGDVVAIEEDDGVGGGLPRFGAGLDGWRLGPVSVVDAPGTVGEHGGVVVAGLLVGEGRD